MGESSRHPSRTPVISSASCVQLQTAEGMPSFQFLAWEKEFIFSSAKTHELPWVDGRREGTLKRDSQEQQGQTRAITADAQAFPTDLGARKGHGGALWNILPEHWMRGMQVGRAMTSGINSC